MTTAIAACYKLAGSEPRPRRAVIGASAHATDERGLIPRNFSGTGRCAHVSCEGGAPNQAREEQRRRRPSQFRPSRRAPTAQPRAQGEVAAMASRCISVSRAPATVHGRQGLRRA
jgi:hypothetical protein